MIDLKKKCWREKVTAEITVAHVLRLAKEMGSGMNAADAALFLNEKGRAQAVWTHMMQAGEEFLKSDLAGRTGSATAKQGTTHNIAPTPTLSRKHSSHAGGRPPFYQ